MSNLSTKEQLAQSIEKVECWNCGGTGLSYHDCGEDCCCCAEPENNMRCDICNGKGWLIDRLHESMED